MAEQVRHRVVIVGAGFGGLYAARTLKRAPADVTMINGTNPHVFEPLIYQVAAGILSPGEVAVPVREVVRRQKNTEFVLGTVTDVDPAARNVTMPASDGASTYQVDYDTLIVAAGATQSYFGHDEYANLRPGPEDGRRRARDPRTGVQRVRDGRAQYRPRRAGPPADVCDRRWRPYRRGDGRTDRRDRPPHAPRSVPAHRPAPGAHRPARRGRSGPAHLRPTAVRRSGTTAAPDRRGRPPRRNYWRPRSTGPGGSWSTPTSRCRVIPRSSSSARP